MRREGLEVDGGVVTLGRGRGGDRGGQASGN